MDDAVLAELEAFRAHSDAEEVDRQTLLSRVAAGRPFDRREQLHLTGSAIVVHPPSGRLLLRFHPRIGRFLQLGGHGEETDRSIWDVARREAAEESGLVDLEPFPGPQAQILQVVIVEVQAVGSDPAHRHGDVRYVLSTSRPDQACAEEPAARLQWVTPEQAFSLATEANLVELIERVAVQLRR